MKKSFVGSALFLCYNWPMKVLFFNYEYPPLGAGAANASAYILEEFSKIPGLEVDFVTSSIDRNYHLKEIGTNVKIHRLPIGKNGKKLHYQSKKDIIIYTLKTFFFSRKLIRKAENSGQPYNLTHSFFTVPCGFVSLIFRKQYNIPYIISLRGSDVPGYSDRFIFLYNFLKPLVKFIWNNAAEVVSNSEGLRDLARKTDNRQDFGIIYNGVDIETFKPAPEARPNDKFIITNGASRITARKGYGYLIEAVNRLQKKYPNLLAKIMGEGDDKKRLEGLVKNLELENNVQLLGRIHRDKLAPYYQEASLFVMPSLNEGMSNAMLEALASGLPIITTETGGTKELVKDRTNGLIINMKDAEDMAQKISLLIDNLELRNKMAVANRELAKTMSWGSVANQYFDLYKNVTAAKLEK